MVRALILREPLSRVVLVALLPLGTRFLLRMPLRRVAHLGVGGLRARREGPQVRVLGKLVVAVIAPGARLMPAAGAVVHRVVVVLLMGQTQRLQGLIRLGADQSTELVIAIVGGAQIALDLHDVARLVVLVQPAHQDLGGLVGCRGVLHLDAGRSLQRIVGQGLGGPWCRDLLRHPPAVVAVADLALVGQGDLGQSPLVVAVRLRAAIRVGVALQLAVGVEALADREAEAA